MKLGKLMRIDFTSRWECSTLWDYGINFCWAEESVSGYKCMFTLDMGLYSLYVSFVQVELQEKDNE